jgi:alkanesulfonate monooxygenase SsuD/methylene tetrahydromethanopterin reductase-like flavin-dependent oxidoreductase (luciferase family)
MRFGVFYELQLPRPWNQGDERNLFHQALEQVELADRLGYDYAWEVEHHFLEEYSHSSAPEVFLAAAAARTKTIRLGHGIRQVIPNYNHPARTADGLATLDIISDGRVDFGIGEGATRLELGGFRIPAKEKRAMALEAAEQIANMMVLQPYPGFEGKYFSMPCRNILPKPVQSPHPPMWMACTNRDTIKIAAQNGVGALASPSSTPRKHVFGPISITASSNQTPACRLVTRSTLTLPWCRASRCIGTAPRPSAAASKVSSSSATRSTHWLRTTPGPAAAVSGATL